MSRLLEMITIMLVVHLALYQPGRAWSFLSTSVSDIDSVDPLFPGLEVGAALVKSSHTHNGIHSKAREYLKSLDQAPSCVRQAASGLIDDCSSLTSKVGGTATVVDHLKALYAAKLALCELKEAGLAIPAECKVELLGCFHKSSPRSNDNAESLLAHCLHALEARPQFWTSYSNNRQNAILLCQASRAEVEREDMLSDFKLLLNNNQAVQEVVFEAIELWRQQSEEHKAFKAELKDFQAEMAEKSKIGLQEMAQRVTDAQDHADAFGEGLKSLLADLVRRTRDAFSDLWRQQAEATQRAMAGINDIVDTVALHNHELSDQFHQNHEMQRIAAAEMEKELLALMNQQGELGNNINQMTISSRRAIEYQEELIVGIITGLDEVQKLKDATIDTQNALGGLVRIVSDFLPLANGLKAVFAALVISSAWTIARAGHRLLGTIGLITCWPLCLLLTIYVAAPLLSSMIRDTLSSSSPMIAPLIDIGVYGYLLAVSLIMTIIFGLCYMTCTYRQKHQQSQNRSADVERLTPMSQQSFLPRQFFGYDPTSETDKPLP